jgi:hypothetical protein
MVTASNKATAKTIARLMETVMNIGGFSSVRSKNVTKAPARNKNRIRIRRRSILRYFLFNRLKVFDSTSGKSLGSKIEFVKFSMLG